MLCIPLTRTFDSRTLQASPSTATQIVSEKLENFTSPPTQKTTPHFLSTMSAAPAGGKLFVGNLAWTTDSGSLKSAFGQFGDVSKSDRFSRSLG
jgi:RNA recognition motif-containing protein